MGSLPGCGESVEQQPCGGSCDCGSGIADAGQTSPDAATVKPDAGASKPAFLPVWSDDPCASQAKHKPGYGSTIARWVAQDAKSMPPANGLLVVGSSSVRYWKTLFREFAAWRVVQRGYGGSLIWDTAGHAAKIVLPYRPRAVLIYAGTNDISKGTSPDQVLSGYRCLVQRIRLGLGDVHVAFIGITPNPARWSQWSRSVQVNAAVKGLAYGYRGLHYIDIPAAFLKTGQPPSTTLFVSDKLHLNAEGYKLWNKIIKPAVQKFAPIRPHKPPAGQPGAGARVLVDLGPSNGTDGNHSKSPDSQGQRWNNWHEIQGSGATLPGEALGLRTVAGKATPWRLVLGGAFGSNGLQHGGLQQPSAAKLGQLAVATATQDFFYVSRAGGSQELSIAGLEPARRYKLRLFGSRATAQETRVTRYTVTSAAGATSKTLKTSGNNIGSDGKYDGNDNTVVTFDNLRSDAWGKLHLEVSADSGAYGYLSLLELSVK